MQTMRTKVGERIFWSEENKDREQTQLDKISTEKGRNKKVNNDEITLKEAAFLKGVEKAKKEHKS